MHFHLTKLLIGLIITSVFAFAMIAGCGESEEAGRTTGPSPASEARSVCVVASGDTHGWIIPCGCTSNQSGGLLRRATFLKQQSENSLVIPVDVGGAADGTAPYQLERFRAILRGEHSMGLKAHNVGQAELAFGIKTLAELSADTGVTFISSNLTQGGSHPFASHVFIDEGGRSMAFIGVLSPQYAVEGVEISDPGSAVLNVLDAMDSRPAHVVVLAYLPTAELRKLAESLPEVDVVFGGPTGQALKPEMIGQTMLVSATNKGKFLATATFATDGQSVAGDIFEMSPVYPDNDSQVANLKLFRQVLEERDFSASESGFVKASTAMHAAVAGSQSCRECHEQTNDHWDGTGHAHAWQTLQNETAHVDPYCQQCHTTGYGLTDGFASLKKSPLRQDVGCESCHGPSAAHVADSNVKTPYDAAGSCRKCHDEENSPHFEFDSYWEKVKHE